MKWDNIPAELKNNGLWCLWRLTDGKKLPYDAQTGSLAKSNDKTTFYPFATVVRNFSKYYGLSDDGRVTGGLGLGIFDGFSAVDIDHCRDAESGALSAMAEEIIQYVASYTEISPSGTGIRIIFKTDTSLDKAVYYTNNRKNGLEIYISNQTNKFVTITGNALTASGISSVDIKYILDKFMRKNMPTVFDPTRYGKDTKLNALWQDDHSGDESGHDLALLSKLSYYLNGDRSRVVEAFEASPYYTGKDDKHLQKWRRDDYREQTLDKACQNVPPAISEPTVHIDEFGLTDTGNAHKFIGEFGEQLRYNVDNKAWMYWNGKYWQFDTFGNIKNFAESVIELMKIEAKTCDDENARKSMLANVKRALSSSGKISMLKEAEHLSGIPVTNEMFDTDPWQLNTASGVVDLRTGILTQPTREMMLSKYVPYEIDRTPPKLWLKFLGEIFEENQEAIDYIQKMMGYSITGSTREQCMFMLIGDGSNGKSLLLDIMNKALGSYASASNVEILLEKHNGNNANLGDVARLNKIRNVVTSETQIGAKMNESAIKSLTSGNDKIVARFLYGNEFEFTPIFKIFMASNYKPVIRGNDHGIWRRIRAIPFNVVIPDEKQDKALGEKLSAEIPQILAWMIRGCGLWQRDGLIMPDVFAAATDEYRDEMDVIKRWLDETCEYRGDLRTSSSDLYQNFKNYAKDNTEYVMSHTQFGRNLQKKMPRAKKRIGGTVWYYGIGLKPDNRYQVDDRAKYDDV